MKKPFIIQLYGGATECSALPTPYPGLVLADVPVDDDGYRFALAHVGSNAAVLWADDAETLAAVSSDLSCVDWTRPATDLVADEFVQELVATAARTHGLCQSGRMANPAGIS